MVKAFLWLQKLGFKVMIVKVFGFGMRFKEFVGNLNLHLASISEEASCANIYRRLFRKGRHSEWTSASLSSTWEHWDKKDNDFPRIVLKSYQIDIMRDKLIWEITLSHWRWQMGNWFYGNERIQCICINLKCAVKTSEARVTVQLYSQSFVFETHRV